MSISFTPSQVAVLVQAESLYGDNVSESARATFWALRKDVQTNYILVQRAYWRFSREFDGYQLWKARNPGERLRSLGGLSEVRKYHRLLLEAMRDLEIAQQQAWES